MIYAFLFFKLCVFEQEGHDLQEAQEAHEEQLPPQTGCLPARFAFIIEIIMHATIISRIKLTITVPI